MRKRAFALMAKLKALANDTRAPPGERQAAQAKYEQLRKKWAPRRGQRQPRSTRPWQPRASPPPEAQFHYDADRAAAQAAAIAALFKMLGEFLKFVLEPESDRP
jgi:hypothetical protein